MRKIGIALAFVTLFVCGMSSQTMAAVHLADMDPMQASCLGLECIDETKGPSDCLDQCLAALAATGDTKAATTLSLTVFLIGAVIVAFARRELWRNPFQNLEPFDLFFRSRLLDAAVRRE